MSSKTPKSTAGGKPTTTPGKPKATPGKPQPQAGKSAGRKPEQKHPEHKPKKEQMEIEKNRPEEEDDEDDEDDEIEQETFTTAKKSLPPSSVGKKTADPEDEDDEDDQTGAVTKPLMNGDKEDDEDEEAMGDDVYVVLEHLGSGNQIGMRVPAGESLTVVGAEVEGRTFPLHITNACLGPHADANDRATLVATLLSESAHEHEDEDEEEEHEHDDEDDMEEIVCGTLCRNVAENITLDLVVEGNFILSNTASTTDIYVTARVIGGDSFDDDDDEDDMEGLEEEEEEEEDDDEDEDDKQDEGAIKAKAMEMRKRLLGTTESESGSKKAKIVAPKVLDVAPSASKKDSKVDSKATKGSDPKAKVAEPNAGNDSKGKATVSAEELKTFLMKELKAKKQIKMADLGSAIAKEFKKPFKQMGFEEKVVSKFLEKHCGDKTEVVGEMVKLK